MKEKYIFYTLLIFSLVFFTVSAAGKKNQDSPTPEESAMERKLKQAAPAVFSAVKKVDIDQIQNAVSFTAYETMIDRSPFLKRQPRTTQVKTYPQEGKKENFSLPLPVDKGPRFIYKGRIVAAGRFSVIIEEAWTKEVFMVSQGGDIEGYKVLDITDSEVILSNQQGEKIILPTVETVP